MTDADVYAYEQEFEDEWEAMHAHEMEAAEEEMMAMEAAEQRIVSQKELSGAPEAQSPADRAKSAMDDADASLSRPQSRLDSVLARCATLLGEDEGDVAMEDVELRAARVVQKEKAATTSEGTTTAEFLYNRPPIDVDSLPVVLRDGRRRFLRKKQSSAESTSTTLCVAATPLISIREMMENIERIEIEEAASIEEEGNVAPTLETDDVKPPPVANTTLWLDKYRPQSFLDLLSDERTNREVLSWIKSWDLFVFPKKKRVNESHSTPPAKKSVFNSAGGKSPWNQQVTQNDYDDVEDKRPTNKIILICGPPGAGKTTLANIVARHAGYNPIEVNASDDRTPSVLRNKIVSAMEMQSIFGERKPNCIILDEIDGAMNGTDGRSAIEVIHEMAAAPLFKKKAGAKTSSKTRHPLVRPLICICNDMYASVLRPLRQLAKIFLLDTPHPQRLVTRLKFICRHEGIKASTGALAALCSSADNDIRYCLNTLQFQYMQSRGSGKGTSSLATLNAGLVGQKDHVHGMFEAMNLVFYESRSKSAKGEQPIEEKIEEAAISLGNYPLLINGLDENVPKMIFNDPTMKKICDVFEWLGLADAWETRARSEQQRRVEYPRSHFEAQKRGERSQNILVSLTEGAQLQPSLRLSTSVLVVDVVPWIIATLSPNIRRINPSLQTKEEKTMIERLIQLMASLGLSFRHKYLPDGTEDYALEPALNELVMFRGTEGDAAYQSVLPLTVRKMIAREVELEQMRRIESTAAPIAKQNGGKVALGSANRSGDLAKSVFVLPELSEAELAVKDEASRKRNPFAFAHREAKRKRTEILKVQNKQQRPSKVRTGPVVRYKFNEGYTCGIKTTVYVRDLL